MPSPPPTDPASAKSALSPAGAAQSLLLHNRMLGERLHIYSLARFLVVAGIVIGALGAKHIVGIEELDVASLLFVAAMLFAYNAVAFALVQRCRQMQGLTRCYRVLVATLHATITLDFVFLTVALWLVGGPKSPFIAFYILNVIIAGVLLSRLAACLHALVAYLMFAGLVLGEWSGMIPSRWPVGAVAGANGLDGRYVLTVLVVQGMLMAVSVFFLTGLTRLLRTGERQLRQTNLELERLSRMQRDFLQIALHDLKAPVAAVTGLLYNLASGLGGPLTEKQDYWLSRSQIRLKELTTFLKDLHTLSFLESGKIAEHVKEIDLAGLLEHVVEDNQDLAQMQMHSLTLEAEEVLPPIFGIDTLIAEAVANLVTNAIKYTPLGGAIVVRGLANDGVARIEVQDNGIGISPEDLERLFQEFVRIRRRHASLGRVSGSGLGLSIAKRVVALHGGRIEVTSKVDKGSTFTIVLPIHPASDVLFP